MARKRGVAAQMDLFVRQLDLKLKPKKKRTAHDAKKRKAKSAKWSVKKKSAPKPKAANPHKLEAALRNDLRKLPIERTRWTVKAIKLRDQLSKARKPERRATLQEDLRLATDNARSVAEILDRRIATGVEQTGTQDAYHRRYRHLMTQRPPGRGAITSSQMADFQDREAAILLHGWSGWAKAHRDEAHALTSSGLANPASAESSPEAAAEQVPRRLAKAFDRVPWGNYHRARKAANRFGLAADQRVLTPKERKEFADAKRKLATFERHWIEHLRTYYDTIAHDHARAARIDHSNYEEEAAQVTKRLHGFDPLSGADASHL